MKTAFSIGTTELMPQAIKRHLPLLGGAEPPAVKTNGVLPNPRLERQWRREYPQQHASSREKRIMPLTCLSVSFLQ